MFVEKVAERLKGIVNGLDTFCNSQYRIPCKFVVEVTDSTSTDGSVTLVTTRLKYIDVSERMRLVCESRMELFKPLKTDFDKDRNIDGICGTFVGDILKLIAEGKLVERMDGRADEYGDRNDDNECELRKALFKDEPVRFVSHSLGYDSPGEYKVSSTFSGLKFECDGKRRGVDLRKFINNERKIRKRGLRAESGIIEESDRDIVKESANHE